MVKVIECQTDKPTTLQLPNFYGLIGIICVAFWISVPFYIYVNEGIDGLAIGIPFTIIYLLLPVSLVMPRWNMKVIILENELVKISFIGIKKKMLLEDIKSISFNKWTLELTLKDGNITMKCHQHLIGFEKLLIKLEKHGIEIPHLRTTKK